MSAVADHRVQPLGQICDQICDLGQLQGASDLGVAGVGTRVAQVSPDRVVEQVRLLRDHADPFTKGRQAGVPQVDPADLHRPRGGVVEPGDQGGQGRLARPRGPDQGHEPPGVHPHGDLMQHLATGAPVA